MRNLFAAANGLNGEAFTSAASTPATPTSPTEVRRKEYVSGLFYNSRLYVEIKNQWATSGRPDEQLQVIMSLRLFCVVFFICRMSYG
jgi:hypothetical protein